MNFQQATKKPWQRCHKGSDRERSIVLAEQWTAKRPHHALSDHVSRLLRRQSLWLESILFYVRPRAIRLHRQLRTRPRRPSDSPRANRAHVRLLLISNDAKGLRVAPLRGPRLDLLRRERPHLAVPAVTSSLPRIGCGISACEGRRSGYTGHKLAQCRHPDQELVSYIICRNAK